MGTTRLRRSILGGLLLCGSVLGCGDGSDNGGDGASTPTRPVATAVPTATMPVPASQTPTATPTGDTRLDIAVCAPPAGPFSATIDHPYFSLLVGMQWILTAENDEGAVVRLEVTALDETEAVAGVTTRVVEEREWEDGELIEVARNFFVRAPDGTLCYYGEDVDNYEGGEIVNHDGTWRAGRDGARPGIFLPAAPQVGQAFQQEVAPGVAEDEAEIAAIGETVEVPLGTYSDTVRLLEHNPLDGGTSTKIYARDVGLLRDDEFERLPPEGP